MGGASSPHRHERNHRPNGGRQRRLHPDHPPGPSDGPEGQEVHEESRVPPVLQSRRGVEAMKFKDAVIRAGRTALQVVVGVELVVRGIQAALPEGFEVKGVNIDKVTSAAYAALVAVAVAITAFVQNVAEDNTSFQLPK